MADTTEQGTQPQDQVTPAPEAAAPAAPASTPESQPEQTAQPAPTPSQGPTGPWANDLAEAFSDEATRSQVDAFLRQKVQPHVTKTEQDAANARKLYDAFVQDGDQAFLDIAAELYDEDTAKAIEEYLEYNQGPEAQPNTTQPQRDEEVQALLDWKREQDEQTAFNEEFERVNHDNALDRDLFIPFVAKAGDFDKAREDYLAHQAALREAAGVKPEESPAPTPPPVVGSEQASGATVPPTQEEYASLDDALDAFFDEQRSGSTPVAPPVPG